jgi:hypothetical protein
MKFTTPHYSDIPSKLSSADSDIPSDCDGRMLEVPKKTYLPYPVTKEWGDDVRAELKKRGRGSQTRMLEHVNKALHAELSSGHLSDILSGKYDTSDAVGPIHEFLQWPDPLPPIASRDTGELAHLYARLTPEQRAKFEAARGNMTELSGDEARQLLALLFPGKK